MKYMFTKGGKKDIVNNLLGVLSAVLDVIIIVNINCCAENVSMMTLY